MERTQQDKAELGRQAFEVFTERFPYIFVMLDPSLSVEWVSEACARVLGSTPQELVGASATDLVHAEDFANILPLALESAVNAEEILERPAVAVGSELLVRVINSSQEWVPMSVTARVFDDEGSLLCSLRPAYERQAMDRVFHELSQASDLSRTLEAVISLVCAQFSLDRAWFIHDFDGDLSVVGPEAECDDSGVVSLLEDIRSAPISKNVRFTEDYWVVPLMEVSDSGLLGALVLPACRQGGPTPYDLYVLERARSLSVVAFARAESDRVLHRRANTDHLTGIVNRRAFELELDDLSSDDDISAAVIFVDLDDFKVVNDDFGHAVGDQVLIAVATRMSSAVRGSDVVARLGGDEFAVICRNLPAHEVETMRSRIEKSISQPVGVGAVTLAISASVGAATASSSEELRDILRRSDADMYERKGRQMNAGS